MTQNLLSRAELGYFLQNRKKLDDAIGEILGPGIHLHDISQSSGDKSIQKSNSFIKKTPNILQQNLMSTPTQKTPIVTPLPLPSPSARSQKYDNFFSNISAQNKLQKLYKQNMQLHKKMMDVKDENQQYKNKATLWEKMKQYILENVHKQFNFKSIRYNFSDGAILDEFIVVLGEMLSAEKDKEKQRDKEKQKNQNFSFVGNSNKIYGFGIGVSSYERDHVECRQLQEQTKRKFDQQMQKVLKLNVKIQMLTRENNLLRENQENFKKQRKVRMSQIQQGIGSKFIQIQKSLQEKTAQNLILNKKISSLESQIYELRNNASPLALRRKDKTISTNPQTVQDFSQIELYRKMSKIKDDQINILKQESKMLSSEVSSLKINNQKMKKVIKLAQNLNNEFLQKLEQSMKKSHILEPFNEYYQTNFRQKAKQGQGRQSGLGLWMGQGQQDDQFHFANKRFKIIKSRSLQKQRFAYGEKEKK